MLKRLTGAAEPCANVLLMILGAPFQAAPPSKVPRRCQAARLTGAHKQAPQGPLHDAAGSGAGLRGARPLSRQPPSPSMASECQVKAVTSRELTKAPSPRMDSQQAHYQEWFLLNITSKPRLSGDLETVNPSLPSITQKISSCDVQT